MAWGVAAFDPNGTALEIANEALKQEPTRDAWAYQRALARVGALKSVSEGGDAGHNELRAVLRWSQESLRPADARPTSEHVEARRVLAAWWAAAADARLDDARLLEEGSARLRDLSPLDRIGALKGCSDALVALGVAGSFVDELRSVLTPSGAQAVRADLAQFYHPDDAWRVGMQDCAEALARCHSDFGGEAALAYPSLILSAPTLIDEFSIAPLVDSLRTVDEPLEVAGRWQVSLDDRGRDYESQLVGIAGLRAASEGNDPSKAWPSLEAALERAWGFPVSQELPKHRVLTRLLPLIPLIAPANARVALLGTAVGRVSNPATPISPLGRNEVLVSVVVSAGNAACGLGALGLLSDTVDDVEHAWTPRDPAHWWRHLEALNRVVVALRAYGADGEPLLDRVATLVQEVPLAMLSHSSDQAGHLCAATLTHCAGSYAELERYPERDQGLKRVREISVKLNPWDLMEGVGGLAAEARRAGSLALAGEALRGAELFDAKTQGRFRAELVGKLAQAAVGPLRQALTTG